MSEVPELNINTSHLTIVRHVLKFYTKDGIEKMQLICLMPCPD